MPGNAAKQGQIAGNKEMTCACRWLTDRRLLQRLLLFDAVERLQSDEQEPGQIKKRKRRSRTRPHNWHSSAEQSDATTDARIVSARGLG